MRPYFSWATGMSAVVTDLIREVRDRIPVSGWADPKTPLGALIYPWPARLKPRGEPVRWLLDRSTAEGSLDAFLWAQLGEHLGPVADLLRQLKEILELYSRLKAKAFVKAFNRLLREKLFSPSFLPGQTYLTITYSLIDDNALIDLQRAAHAIGMPKPRREPVQREPVMEQQDKMIYEEACKGTPYSVIKGHIRTKYPSSQNLGHLQVSISRIFQIANEYAKRHGLPKPARRHQRRS
jgi:hypothetical protein